jgi:glycosyltransferase involved in cell wall biosynthesis
MPKSELPSVSLLCPTFGRVELLQESIECFLRQDYDGPLELVIVNDLPRQSLSLGSQFVDRLRPNQTVRMVNCKERCRSLGEKKNATIRSSRGSVLKMWDDDDIHLPWSVSSEVGALINSSEAYGVLAAYFFANGDNVELKRGSLPGPFCMKRDLMLDSGGMSIDRNCGEDVEFRERMIRTGNRPFHMKTKPSFIYRWGTGHYHISGHGEDKPGKVSGYEVVGKSIEKLLDEGKIPEGTIELVPSWREDWVEKTRPLLEGFTWWP